MVNRPRTSGTWTTAAGVVAATLAIGASWSAFAVEGADVQARIDVDLAAGRPIVVHVVVALCDNAHQGIVPVPDALGDGRDPDSNLYWGARYGVRTHLVRTAGWTSVSGDRPDDARILRRAVLRTEIERDGNAVPVYVVADAWAGDEIRSATRSFLDMAAGHAVETVAVDGRTGDDALRAGGGAHVVGYVGHNGLMDFDVPAPAAAGPEAPPRGAIVLACASKPYFAGALRSVGAHPILLTTGLMAPEAYSLDAALRSWISKRSTEAAVEAAAEAYHRFQKCGMGAARRLFWGEP